MDYATKLALRAIVSGLEHSRAIDKQQVAAIVRALGDAMEKANSENQRGAEHELGVLRDGIARDAGLNLRGEPIG